MAGAKTVETAAPVDKFLGAVEPAGLREDARALAMLIARVTGESAAMWGSAIVGFGRTSYPLAGGKTGETMRVGFAARKSGLVIYGLALDQEGERLARLGKHSTGKGCLYLKRLGDADAQVLEELLAAARG